MAMFATRRFCMFGLLACALFVFPPLSTAARADDVIRHYYGEQAREITRRIRAGDGWSIVSARQNVRFLPDGYPFVLSARVVEKLRFVHEVVVAQELDCKKM
jgi:hypothetical protein